LQRLKVTCDTAIDMPKFSLITLNCFGVPTPATHARLSTLAADLNQRAVDAICFQEVQANIYRRLLIGACTTYPGHAYEPFVHAPKGGLLTLAHTPIESSAFDLYRERGLWYTPALADWILHKGVLITRIKHDGLTVVLLNTHLTANYTGDWKRGNLYARHEWEQLRQLAQIVHAQPPDALIIVAGDFNVPRGSWLADEFIALAGLIDPLAGSTQPTYRPTPPMPARYAAAIDFTLIRLPAQLATAQADLQAEATLIYREKHTLSNGKSAYLSDHCGIKLALTWG